MKGKKIPVFKLYFESIQKWVPSSTVWWLLILDVRAEDQASVRSEFVVGSHLHCLFPHFIPWTTCLRSLSTHSYCPARLTTEGNSMNFFCAMWLWNRHSFISTNSFHNKKQWLGTNCQRRVRGRNGIGITPLVLEHLTWHRCLLLQLFWNYAENMKITWDTGIHGCHSRPQGLIWLVAYDLPSDCHQLQGDSVILSHRKIWEP